MRGERQAGGALRLVLFAFALSACPKDERPAFDESDRTIQKLKAERARLDQAGTPPPVAPTFKPAEPDPLTEAAVKSEPPKTLTLASTAPVQAGRLTLTPSKLETMQTVAGAKVSLSTADRFVRVTLSAVALEATPLDLRSAELGSGDARFRIARDVQRLGGTPTSAVVGDQPQDLVIFFEVPPDAVKAGLKLLLPTDAGTVEVLLQ